MVGEGGLGRVSKQERHQDQKGQGWWVRWEWPGVSHGVWGVAWGGGWTSEMEEGIGPDQLGLE